MANFKCEGKNIYLFKEIYLNKQLHVDRYSVSDRYSVYTKRYSKILNWSGVIRSFFFVSYLFQNSSFGRFLSGPGGRSSRIDFQWSGGSDPLLVEIQVGKKKKRLGHGFLQISWKKKAWKLIWNTNKSRNNMKQLDFEGNKSHTGDWWFIAVMECGNLFFRHGTFFWFESSLRLRAHLELVLGWNKNTSATRQLMPLRNWIFAVGVEDGFWMEINKNTSNMSAIFIVRYQCFHNDLFSHPRSFLGSRRRVIRYFWSRWSTACGTWPTMNRWNWVNRRSTMIT